MSIPVIKMATIGILPSPLKKLYYRLRGAKIGRNVKFSLFSIISAKSIEIGDDSKIGLFSIIMLKDGLKMGKRVKINSMVAIDTGSMSVDDDTVIMEQTVIGGMLTQRSRIDIGKRVKIFPYCFINPTEPITIKDDVGIGGSTYIFTHGSWKNVLDGYPASFGPVTLEERVWLPWRVFIMPGVTIGADTIIAASSTVTKSIPAKSLAYGAPAKSVDYSAKALSDKQKLAKLHEIMTEFTEYQNYLGRQADISGNENSKFTVFLNNEKALFIINFDDECSLAEEKIIVSVRALDTSLTTKFDSEKIAWFDIESTRASFDKSEFPTEIYNYLGRFGIRFGRD